MTVDGADVQRLGRRRRGAGLHARQRARPRPQRRRAAPRPVPRQQPGPAAAGRRPHRPVGQDRQHQLLQGLRRRGEVIMRATLITRVARRRTAAFSALVAAPAARAVAEHRRPSSCSSSTRPAASSATPTVIGHQQRDRRDARGRRPARTAAATIPALPLTGTLHRPRDQGRVRRRGRQRPRAALRRDRDGEGEAASASGGQTEVIVFGTNQGVRADAQIGRRLDSETIDEMPILGRKVTTLPLFNSAFRQGKGTGDLFVNATYFITGVGQPPHDHLHARRRQQRRGWGRQTMLATVPVGAVQEISVLTNAFSAEFGWTAGPGDQHRHQVRHQRAARRGAVPRRGPAARRRRRSRPTASARRRCRAARRRARWRRSIRPMCPTSSARSPARSAGRSSRTRRSSSPPPTTRTRTGRRSCRRTLPSFVLPPDGSLSYVGHYRQKLFNAPRRSQAHADADADGARQLRSLLRHQPERRGRRHQRADRRPPLHARGVDRRRSITRRCSARRCSTKRGSAICTGTR